MPSENVHDGLPTYQRVYSLRRMAAAVIRSMPRTARQTEAGRKSRTAPPKPDAAASDAPACPAPTPREAPRDRPALPRSPHRTYDDTAMSAERLREHLRRERRTEF